MDRQGTRQEKEGGGVGAREEDESKEGDNGDREGIENEASSEEENSSEEGGGGPIKAIIDLLQLAAPILEDLSDVRRRKEEKFHNF